MSHITVGKLDRVRARATSLAPGVAVSAIIALAAAFISEHHGGPTLVYAFFVGGMFLHALSLTSRTPLGLAGVIAVMGLVSAMRFPSKAKKGGTWFRPFGSSGRDER